MAIENASYLHALDAQYPATGDQIPEGDDHIRMVKSALKNTFPGRNGADSRTIVKTYGFTPAITEISAIYHITAEVTVSLPLLSGLPEGAYFVFKAVGGAVTVTPYSGNTLDCTTLVIAQGSWAILAKQGTVWTTMTSPVLTAAAITAALGSTAVQNATYATSAGSATTATDSTKVAKTGDTMTGNLTISNSAPRIGLVDTTSGNEMSTLFDDDIIGFYKTGIGWKMYVTSGGNIWTSAFGFISDYFALSGHAHDYSAIYLPLAGVDAANSKGALVIAYAADEMSPAVGTSYSASTTYINSKWNVGFTVSGTWKCVGIVYGTNPGGLFRKVA